VVARDAEVANELEIEFEAQLDVPCKLPVNDVAFTEVKVNLLKNGLYEKLFEPEFNLGGNGVWVGANNGKNSALLLFAVLNVVTASAEVALPCKLPVILGAFNEPVICWLPEIITVPIKVCVSFVASPNWLEPEEYITEADSYVTFKNVIEAVPFNTRLPLNVKS
jgi:hypothetical protein